MNESEEILPFPIRNPLLPIKDYQKQLLEDKKKELGFGYIKLDQSIEVLEEKQEKEILNLSTVDKCLS